MAEPPILTLSGVGLTFGGDPLLVDASLAIHPGERAALVGRNGSGKSTLLRLIAGSVEPDVGERFLRPGKTVSVMPQEPDFAGFATLWDYAGQALGPEDFWRVEMAFEGLDIDGARSPEQASGGERRRAALGRILAEAADLMLLDEPTNHLDIATIRWLEDWLAKSRSAFVVISHDRAFLRAVSDRTLWLDRGVLRQSDRGFAGFEEWRDRTYEEEDQARHKLDRLIRSEGRWAVEGISARRKRNQGRVRRLSELREERRAQIRRAGAASMTFEAERRSGRVVIDAKDVSKAFEGRTVISDFSLRIQRGERVALVGPNGVGKTTLLRLLTGRLQPDAGSVRLGANLAVAYFDQNREELDPTLTLWQTLTGDAELGASGRNDQMMVRGAPRHVIGYLKDFLFHEGQARGPVSALSGGEKARLLLARLMARDSNLLILDEPTNDLDVETLDLLQEAIDDYDGTVLLVSHDRDFVDRVATTTVAMEGDGQAVVYAGGWSDYRAQRAHVATTTAAPVPARSVSGGAPKASASATPHPRRSSRLGYKQLRRLEELPEAISKLEAEIAQVEELLADPELFARDPAKFHAATTALAERQATLAAAEEEWLELESRREASEA